MSQQLAESEHGALCGWEHRRIRWREIDIKGLEVSRHGMRRISQPAMREHICLHEIGKLIMDKRSRHGESQEHNHPDNNNSQENSDDRGRPLLRKARERSFDGAKTSSANLRHPGSDCQRKNDDPPSLKRQENSFIFRTTECPCDGLDGKLFHYARRMNPRLAQRRNSFPI